MSRSRRDTEVLAPEELELALDRRRAAAAAPIAAAGYRWPEADPAATTALLEAVEG